MRIIWLTGVAVISIILLAVGDEIRGKEGKNRPAALDTLRPRSYIRPALSSGF